ncbi:hypothetical protein [Methylocella silvestris]|nr:hypothetical protein [Methylocella silvestris]
MIDPDPYEDVILRYELTALFLLGDLRLANGDLALTKDGDLQIGSPSYNAMFRLVQAWRLNAPAMRLMFDTVHELRRTKPEREKELDAIFGRGPANGRFLESDDVSLYHMVNDAIGALEVSREALAGSLMIVISSLLDRFRNDLDASLKRWNLGNPSFGGYSAGQVVTAAANSFRHADEWKKAQFSKKDATKEQRRSMDVIRSARGLADGPQAYYASDISEAVLDLLSEGDFERLAKVILSFANGIAEEVKLT